MADIFISYGREDEDRIKGFVSALEQQGWSVFWDRRIPSGETWRSYIGKALDDAKCVVVAWSRHSVSSSWVTEEAEDGRRRGVLIPVLLDPIEQPRGFREIQAADLTGWQPGSSSLRFDELVKDICRRLGNAVALSTTNQISKLSADSRILERPVNLSFDGPTVAGMPNGWFNSEGHVSDVSTRYGVRIVHRDDGVPGSYVVMSRQRADRDQYQ